MRTKRSLQGFSLIESLIAFGVISVLLLGVVRISVANIHLESVALNQSIASMRVSALVERLKWNWQAAATAQTVAQWNQNNLLMLPLGHGNIHCEGKTNLCTVRITWDNNGPQAYAVAVHLAHPIVAPPATNHFAMVVPS